MVIILNNFFVIQVQGIVVGGLASMLAMLMAWAGDLDRAEAGRGLVLAASSVITASLASFLLGLVMVAVIGMMMMMIIVMMMVIFSVAALSRRWQVNPDNVATPIAAALGDLVTLSLLAAVASMLSTTSTPVIVRSAAGSGDTVLLQKVPSEGS